MLEGPVWCIFKIMTVFPVFNWCCANLCGLPAGRMGENLTWKISQVFQIIILAAFTEVLQGILNPISIGIF